jgi:hypothetical protein
MAGALSSLDLRLVETVLQMESGYVLDFTDRTFAEFFEDLDVDIGDTRYCEDGTSKAKRLRRFLRSAEPALAGRALAALLDHRLAVSGESLRREDQSAYRELVERLLGDSPVAATGQQERDGVLSKTFDPELFVQLPLDKLLVGVLVTRMNEAQACLRENAHLATVILCGSVLEGLCLGFGQLHEERAKRAFHRRFNRQPRPLDDWSLREWITVLGDLGHLSPNIEKFGHALRDFRNYVHPGAQLRAGFSPDHHTARIGFQVVLAAVEELSKVASQRENGNGG